MSHSQAQAVTVTMTASGIYVPTVPAVNVTFAQQAGLAQTGASQTINITPVD